MRPLLALVALVPAAFNASAAPAAAPGLAVPICSGSGPSRAIELPLPGKPAREQDNPCCVKGCHSGSNRKKALRQFDPTQ
jgi:hypothetical protein